MKPTPKNSVILCAMKKQVSLTARGSSIGMIKIDGEDYISLTDIARQKNADFPADVVRNWMRSKMTVAFLGLWEQLHNPDFKLVEFDQFKMRRDWRCRNMLSGPMPFESI